MSDIIQILPDAVANQIAAGEVVQRPASVVKELLENSVDAGANSIQLILKDSGKALIQVIDNGKGMSYNDARMSFERHATSKIRKSEDLFSLVTKGFRGEALASIAAVAQVEMKTRRAEDEIGTLVMVEGSKVRSHEITTQAVGSQILVKNLFYNVPARRQFLKSDAIELKHSIDEFQRVALTHPDIEFIFYHDGAELFHLPIAPLRQRIVHVFSSRYSDKLVPVDEHTDVLGVSGFIGKPEIAKKTRGEQFFFINRRFIRNAYLQHAVISAFDDVLHTGLFPLFLLYIEIDPSEIDINIHPTKTEIKFKDDRLVYAIVHAAVKRALGRFSIAPSMDFDQENGIQMPPPSARAVPAEPRVNVDLSFNPFGKPYERSAEIQQWFQKRDSHIPNNDWKELYTIADHPRVETLKLSTETEIRPFQVMRRFILSEMDNNVLWLIDQQRAHERILFEEMITHTSSEDLHGQTLLFPVLIELTKAEFSIFNEIKSALDEAGFVADHFGGTTIQVTTVPSMIHSSDIQSSVQTILQSVKEDRAVGSGVREKAIWSIAQSGSIKYGQLLTVPEMVDLVKRLMNCKEPAIGRNKKVVMRTITTDELNLILG